MPVKRPDPWMLMKRPDPWMPVKGSEPWMPARGDCLSQSPCSHSSQVTRRKLRCQRGDAHPAPMQTLRRPCCRGGLHSSSGRRAVR